MGFCAFALGYIYFYSNIDQGFKKMLTVWNVIIFALMVTPAYYGGASAIPAMWKIQLVIQVPLVVIGLYLEITGDTGPWKIAFVGVFLYDANAIMGPNSITGFPMFNTPLD